MLIEQEKLWYGVLSKVSAPKVFLLTLIFTGITPSAIAIFEGNAFFSDRFPDFPFFGKFIVWPVAFLLLFPILNTVLFLFYKSSSFSIVDSLNNGIISLTNDGKASITKILNLATSKTKYIFVIILALFITIGYWFGPTLMFKLNTWCHGAIAGKSFLFYMAFVIWFVEVTLIINAFIDFVLWYRVQKAIAYEHDGIKFQPLLFHPDNAAGLLCFGRTAIRIYFFVFTLIIFVSFQIFEKFLSDPNLSLIQIFIKYKAVPIAFFILIILAPISFFIPLAPFYKKLSLMRREYVNKFNSLVNGFLPSYQTQVFDADLNNIDALKNDSEQMELIKTMHDGIKTIPLWPFDMITIRNFVFTFILPIIVFLFEYFYMS